MKEVLMAQLAAELAPVAATLLSALASWGMYELAKFVRTKTKNEAANDAVTHITETANTTVEELEQTLVPAFKEAASDGKLSKEDRAKLKDLAVRKVNSQIPDKMNKLASQIVNSVDRFIRAKIEKAVLDLKNIAP